MKFIIAYVCVQGELPSGNQAIADIGIHELRSKLAIIPQEPVRTTSD